LCCTWPLCTDFLRMRAWRLCDVCLLNPKGARQRGAVRGAGMHVQKSLHSCVVRRACAAERTAACAPTTPAKAKAAVLPRAPRATGQQRGVEESRERRGRAVRAYLQYQRPARAEAQRRGRNGLPAAAGHYFGVFFLSVVSSCCRSCSRSPPAVGATHPWRLAAHAGGVVSAGMRAVLPFVRAWGAPLPRCPSVSELAVARLSRWGRCAWGEKKNVRARNTGGCRAVDRGVDARPGPAGAGECVRAL